MPLSVSEIRVVLIGAMLAMFLSALDQTIVATALPPIARQFGDFTLISWVVTSYMLTSTCVAPIAGKLSDLYGRRRILSGCLLVFMASSVLCALSTSMEMLIVARAIQGLGGGGLITMSQTIIGDVVAPRERGRYQAYFSAMWASAALLGPLTGGLLTEYWGWPWIFWINLPLGAASLLISDRALRKLNLEPRRSPIDFGSIALLCAGTTAFLLLLSLGGKRLPWTAPEMLGLAVAVPVLCALFLRRQGTSAEPILPPRFLKDRVIRPMLAANVFIPGAYLACSVLLPIYFQVALAASVSVAGACMIPMLLTSAGFSVLGGRYTRWSGHYKLPSLLGLPVTISALLVMAYFADRFSVPVAALILMVAGAGVGPIFPCSMVASQNAVERRDLGAVSGSIQFARALGAAIGVAAASALLLGAVSAGLQDSGPIASLEDLARRDLTPEARAVVAHAFSYLFVALAAGFAAGLAVFAMAEDRTLKDRPAVGAE